MWMPDVNIYVHAFRADSPRHKPVNRWLTSTLKSGEPLGVSELAISGFLRVVTMPKLFNPPSTLAKASAFVEALLAAPSAVRVRPGMQHLEIFLELSRAVGARGNQIPDAFHAALAIEAGATFVTLDEGFAVFAGLKRFRPAE